MIAGSPINFKLFFASSIDLQIIDFAHSRPISVIFFLNFSRSSAFSIASEFAPINSILYFFKIPSFLRAIAALRAVCPPIVGNIASGFSFFIISSIISVVMGSI